MHIVELRAENFKRLKAVRIAPSEGLQQITGRNAQGKSSVLDAVFAALGGAKGEPIKPIRDGEDKAEVVVDLGDMLVRRRWTQSGTSLQVESKEGAVFKSPQAVLDKLLGSLTFDPLAFGRMDPKEKARTLRLLVGLDVTDIELERKAAFDRRTEVGRAGKTAAAQLAAVPVVEAPEEEVSIVDLMRSASTARAANAETANVRATLDKAAAAHEEAKRRLELAQQGLAQAEAAHAAATLVWDQTPAPVDVEAIEMQIAAADDTNRAVRAAAARRKQAEGVDALRAEHEALTKKIAELDARKAELLAAARFPVEGLSVDGDQVTFHKLPLEQASSAEQLRVGLAVAAALNPTLRVVLVRDGSLLDDASLELVATWAAEQKMQVLMERVARPEDGVGIVIEDGEVRCAPKDGGAR